MKIHRVELIVCDPNNEDLSTDDIEVNIENGWGFDGIVHMVKIETKDDGKEWEDNSPLNFTPRRAISYFNKLN